MTYTTVSLYTISQTTPSLAVVIVENALPAGPTVGAEGGSVADGDSDSGEATAALWGPKRPFGNLRRGPHDSWFENPDWAGDATVLLVWTAFDIWGW